MSQFKTKKFKELQEHWYAILRQEGFQDIENTNETNPYLTHWDSIRFQKKNSVLTFESKRYYFEMASEILERHKFECNEDRVIWKLHADGRSLREIAKELKTKVWRVRAVILKLSSIMKGGLDAD